MAAGKTLKDFYMSQDVSLLFLPNTFIDWKTGKEVERYTVRYKGRTG